MAVKSNKYEDGAKHLNCKGLAFAEACSAVQGRLQAETRIANALDAGMLIAKEAAEADKVIMLLSDGDVDDYDCALPTEPLLHVFGLFHVLELLGQAALDRSLLLMVAQCHTHTGCLWVAQARQSAMLEQIGHRQSFAFR